jgi:tetratricopeptide (TPR) repeat protein
MRKIRWPQAGKWSNHYRVKIMPNAKSIEFKADSSAILQTLFDQLTSILKIGFPYSEMELDALYNVGVHLYQQGKWKDASRVFGLINVLAPFNPLYLAAQGKCFKCLGAYEDAHDVFHLAWTIDQSMPASALHAAECLMLDGKKEDAIELINEVLATSEMCGHNVELKEKAEAWLTLLCTGALNA